MFGINRWKKNGKIIVQKSFILFFLVFSFFLQGLADQYTFLGSYRSHKIKENTLTIEADNNVLRLSVIEAGIVRIQLGKENKILNIPSYAVKAKAIIKTKWILKVEKKKLVLEIPEGQVVINKFPLRFQFLDKFGHELDADDPAFGHGWDGKEVRTWKKLNKDTRFFGLGEKIGPLDKRGSYWRMWNTDFYAYSDRQDPLYLGIPFLVGLHQGRAYGIFFDNTYFSTFNLGAGNNRLYSFGAEDGEMDYYFIFGPKIKDVLDRYTFLTGRMTLPPKWALGYQQCRWSYFPEYEVMDVARNFRQRQIPADVIYLDIHYMDKYKVFTWNKERFPEPERMLHDLKKMGFKVVTIIDPGIKVEPGYIVHDEGLAENYFLQYPDGRLFQGAVWPGWCYFPDFSKTSTRAWWGKWYAEMRKLGVSGFWNDMNEPAVRGREFPLLVEFDDGGQKSTIKKIHNVYAYLEAKAAYEGLREHAGNERPFLLTRSGWAGIQKYAAKWTGDNVANFQNLRMSVIMCLSLGLSGVPFVGPDIGGFAGSPTPELFARWIELGTFFPFFRNHTSHGTRDQEPWTFGEEIERIARDCIFWRYQLMPYIYSEFHNTSRTGVPMMRPLFLDYQGDEKVYSKQYQYQFLFGDNILIAPVVEENQRFKKVYLPQGQWLDKWTEKVYEGQSEVMVGAPLERLPAFFRVGSFIPNRQRIQYVDEVPLSELIVDVIAGADGNYILYLDDGLSFDFEKGGFDEISLKQINGEKGLKIISESSDNRWVKGIQTILYKVHNIKEKPAAVELNKTQIAERKLKPSEEKKITIPSYTYFPQLKICQIKLPFKSGLQTVTIRK